MEDYNEIPFREMLGKKIEKNNSERGAEPIGFSLHGGKPIKELYRTVYTGGDDKGYCKDPVIDPKVVQTNAEGATEKTLKSDNGDNGEVRLEMDEGNPEDGETEHKEKSIRDMIAEKNITGFVKTTGTEMSLERMRQAKGLQTDPMDVIMDDDYDSTRDEYLEDAATDASAASFGGTPDAEVIPTGERDRIKPIETKDPIGHNGVGMGDVRYNMAEGKINEAIYNKEPIDELDAASEDAWKQTMGDVGISPDDEGIGNPHMTEEYLRQRPEGKL